MSTIDPRTPVLVGVAAVGQRLDDPAAAVDVVGLMEQAARAAAADAGAPDLLARLQWIAATKGNARLRDPARLVADRVGSSGAHTVLSDIGVLQTAPLRKAAQLIAAGHLDIAMVIGGETKYRSLRAQITGIGPDELDESVEPSGSVPDEHWLAEGDVISRTEIEFGLVHPVQQYAMIENALRAADGQTLDEHRRDIADLYAAMNLVARSNPKADFAQAMDAAFLAEPGPDNRPLAYPYNKWHNSQWNVDQAAAIILCSAAQAQASGVARDQWVFPTVAVESNHMTHLMNRDQLHRCPGFELGAQKVLELSELDADQLGPVELYSCFPVAVRVQQRALGFDVRRPVTVTGGMAFAGGPLNNFVFQALVELIACLRQQGGVALSTAISGMLTKQSLSLYSTQPPPELRVADISAEVGVATGTRAVSAEITGCGQVAAYTVAYQGSEAVTALVIAQHDDGTRTLASSDDPAVVGYLLANEGTGLAIDLHHGRFSIGGP